MRQTGTGQETEYTTPNGTNGGGRGIESPVFIVGPSRSGSTLLSRMLDSHSALAILPESWCFCQLDFLNCLDGFRDRWQYVLFLNRVWHSLQGFNDPAASVLARLASGQPAYVGSAAGLLEQLGRAYATERDARVWGEKTPAHALFLPEIYRLFPRARIVVTVRDPRDILTSYDDYWGGGRRDTEYLMRAAAQIRRYLDRLLTNPGFPERQMHWVRYERLAAEPETVLQDVCRFLGVEFQPQMLEFHQRYANIARDTVAGEHHQLLAKPASSQRIGRYRNALTPEQISLIEQFLSGEMRALDYPTQSLPSNSAPGDNSELARAMQLYRRMASGAFRRRSRQQTRMTLLLVRGLAPILRQLSSSRFAITAQQWRERITVTPGKHIGRRFLLLSECK